MIFTTNKTVNRLYDRMEILEHKLSILTGLIESLTKFSIEAHEANGRRFYDIEGTCDKAINRASTITRIVERPTMKRKKGK